MTGTHVPTPLGVSSATLDAGLSLPARLLADSAPLGWRYVLARVYADDPSTDGFTTPPTDDLLICLVLRGSSTIAAKRPAGWASAHYAPGSVGVTAPGVASTLRWRSDSPARPHSLHLHTAAPLLRRLAVELGGGTTVDRLPDTLLLHDRFVAACGWEFWTGLRQDADPLYAESLAQVLTTRLLSRNQPNGPSRPTAGLTKRQLRQVTELMVDRLNETLTLDELAQAAHLSKFHLVRSFKLSTGMTPHRYLVELRVDHGTLLLRMTNQPVAEIAARCGYASPSRFAAAFRQKHNVSPRDYRRLTSR